MLPSFTDPSLLERALTHRSAARKGLPGSQQSNERLEFLGDAVLELATTEFLFTSFPTEAEGTLTAYRSALVKTTMLARVAAEQGLGQSMHMSNGEESSGGRENPHLLADAFEAVVGALYLDQGFEAAKKYLEAVLFPKIEVVLEQQLYKDPKSHLQELVQAQKLPTPEYTVTAAEGPDHEKQFTVAVTINGQVAGTGVGKSKQSAQQAAARQALKEYTA